MYVVSLREDLRADVVWLCEDLHADVSLCEDLRADVVWLCEDLRADVVWLCYVVAVCLQLYKRTFLLLFFSLKITD